MQYLYQDGDDYYFMDTVTFDYVHISSEALGESVNYLKPEMTIQVEFYGSEPVGIELPQTVDLKCPTPFPASRAPRPVPRSSQRRWRRNSSCRFHRS